MLVGGALSDRYDPRTIMIASSAIRATLVAVLGLLVWTDAAQLWHLYLLGAGFGAADAFFQPAALALVPRLVPEDRLEASNALVMGSMGLAGMVGPAIAGVAVAGLGTALGFGIDAATFAFAVVTLLMVRPRGKPATAATQAAPGGTLAAIGAGLRYASSDAQMRTVLLAVMAINFAVVGPFFVGLPVLVERFETGPMAYGLVLSAFGAAAVVGAMAAGTLGPRARMSIVVPVTSLALGIGMLLIGLAPNAGATALAALPLGAGVGALQVSGMAWLQRRSEPAYLGRVMSLVMFAVMGLTPVSYVIAGAVAESGVAVLFIGAAAAMLALGAATSLSRAWHTDAASPMLPALRH
jgi:MFS family permease